MTFRETIAGAEQLLTKRAWRIFSLGEATGLEHRDNVIDPLVPPTERRDRDDVEPVDPYIRPPLDLVSDLVRRAGEATRQQRVLDEVFSPRRLKIEVRISLKDASEATADVLAGVV